MTLERRAQPGTAEAARLARQRARHAARQKVVGYRLEQLRLLEGGIGRLRDATVPRPGREDEVARALEDVHRQVGRLSAILQTG